MVFRISQAPCFFLTNTEYRDPGNWNIFSVRRSPMDQLFVLIPSTFRAKHLCLSLRFRKIRRNTIGSLMWTNRGLNQLEVIELTSDSDDEAPVGGLREDFYSWWKNLIWFLSFKEWSRKEIRNNSEEQSELLSGRSRMWMNSQFDYCFADLLFSNAPTVLPKLICCDTQCLSKLWWFLEDWLRQETKWLKLLRTFIIDNPGIIQNFNLSANVIQQSPTSIRRQPTTSSSKKNSDPN